MDGKNKALLALYNLLQFLAIPAVLPAMTAFCISRGKYRHQFPQRMGMIDGRRRDQTGPGPIWIHTMSLGEFNAARPLIQRIRKVFPGVELILSASTATGLSALRKSSFAETSLVIAMPFDFLPVVNHVIDRLEPSCFLLVETDIWPNFLWGLYRRGIPAILVNGSISRASAERIKKFPGAAGFLYGPFSLMAVQSGDDARRLAGIRVQASRIRNCGNLKFDYRPVEMTEGEKRDLLEATGFPAGSRIITAGSTHPGEEERIARAFSGLQRSMPEATLIIAPRDVKRTREVADIFKAHGFACKARSGSIHTPGRENPGHQIFILDTLGELERFYGIAEIAFVGGSLVPVGGHNILEPAALGIPVIFGPFMESFRQVADMFMEKGAGFQARDEAEFQELMFLLLTDPKKRRDAGARALELLGENQGVVDRYLDLVSPFFSDPGKAS